MSDERCEVCGATVERCDRYKYPSGGSVCNGAQRREWRAVVAQLRSDLATARQDAERARGLLTEYVPDGHYAHFDREGNAGRTCPACLARSAWRERVRAFLATPTPGPVPSPPVPLAPAELWCAKPRSEARKLGAFGYHFRADDDGDEPCVYCSPGCADASRHLAGPVPGRDNIAPAAVTPPVPGRVEPFQCCADCKTETVCIYARDCNYCELAASEIPGFGTDRDKHRCPKFHREKPLTSPADTKGRP